MTRFIQLWRRRIAAMWSQSDVGYSACLRCWRGYRFVKMHTTPYHACTEPQRIAANRQYGRPDDFEGDECAGVDVLCEDCWGELTVAERLPFYEIQMTAWRNGDALERDIAKVMRAAERGL